MEEENGGSEAEMLPILLLTQSSRARHTTNYINCGFPSASLVVHIPPEAPRNAGLERGSLLIYIGPSATVPRAGVANHNLP
jgi:hypothetical protein